MFDVHVPTNRPETIMDFVSNFEEHMEPYGAKLFINYNGEHDGRVVRCLLAKKNIITILNLPDPHPSMCRLRRDLHKFIADRPWMLFDCDDKFTKDSFEFYSECIIAMNKVKNITGRPAFCGTAGIFGSNFAEDRVHISPRNALMPKGHGLIFDSAINFESAKFNHLDFLKSSLEEATFCALAITEYQAIPLKRFKCPTKITFRKFDDRKKSYVHDYEVWDKNCMAYIRHLANEPSWKYPRKMGDEGSNSPKYFVKYAKDLLKDKRLQEFNLKGNKNV